MRAIIFIVVLFIAGCAAQGALTPEEAYYGLRAAWTRGDAQSVHKFISSSSLQNIETLAEKIRSLDDVRLQALARAMNTAPENLKTLTPEKLIAIQIAAEQTSSSPIAQFLRAKPAKITIHENTAEIINKDGVMMKLVKEGPYWKFEEGVF